MVSNSDGECYSRIHGVHWSLCYRTNIVLRVLDQSDYVVLFVRIYMVALISHVHTCCDHSHHYLGKANFEFMLKICSKIR